jgi:alkanesulfonate monooxygenase SsuD/methylene tetrahydromethanopterin reductase-like flavin-dependent oxidoreductase (luciferase family)
VLLNYKSVAESYGHNPDELSVSVHSWGYIAETDEDAKKEFFPSLKAHHDINRLGLPPIIAYVIGNPKAPALNDDSGVPPVAMEIGVII